VRRHHAHGLSGLRALESRGDRTREDPRVAGPDRAVAPRLERDHPHGPPPDYRSPGRTKVPLRPPVFRTRRTCPRVMPRSTALDTVPAAMRASVPGCIVTSPRATASRTVTGLAETSTMRARPA